MKYSANFERDYNFYLNSIDAFDFCGTLNPKFEAVSNGSRSAKECFYLIESEGENYPCSEPELLNKLLLTKASVNFQIKQWAESRADGTLPLIEFSKREMKRVYPHIKFNESEKTTLSWISGNPFYFLDIETQFKLPEWVIAAVENQKYKFYKK